MGFAGKLEKSFATHTFPTTREELIKDHGDVEIQLPDGTVRFADVLERVPESEFERAEDARLLTYSTFGTAAVGRPGYSDRDPPRSGDEIEQLSF
jgi:hypothetical protein